MYSYITYPGSCTYKNWILNHDRELLTSLVLNIKQHCCSFYTTVWYYYVNQVDSRESNPTNPKSRFGELKLIRDNTKPLFLPSVIVKLTKQDFHVLKTSLFLIECKFHLVPFYVTDRDVFSLYSGYHD